MYWLCFSLCFVHKRNNYHSWIFSLVSNSECGVIDSNFDLQPISWSGLIIFSHYPVLFSVKRLVFVLLAAAFPWFWCAPAHESQQRRSRLERTKVGTLQQEHPVVEHLCVFVCLRAVQHPDQAANCISLWLQDAQHQPRAHYCLCLPPWLSSSH